LIIVHIADAAGATRSRERVRWWCHDVTWTPTAQEDTKWRAGREDATFPRTMPTRILHLDSGREWRGGQRQVLLLADGQRARGLEPLVATSPHGTLIAKCRDHGIAVAAVPMRSQYDLLAVRRILDLIKHWRPDLLHAHDARALAVARVACWMHPTLPLVVTRRSVDRPSRPRHYRRGVARIIAISDAVVDGLRRADVEPERIRRVYPGVRTPHVSQPRDWRRECGWDHGTVVAGMIRAGRDDALEALAAAIERLSPPARAALRVVVFGGTTVGPDALRGLPIFRAGHLHEMPAALAGLDVLVQPVAGEGLGTPLVEALALGVPVIIGRTGSLGELIADGVQGRVVAPGDPITLAQALDELITAPARRAQLGAAGPARAADFDVCHLVDGVAAVYDEARRTSGHQQGTAQ
jgi:glycosyltransferase involved in cell wall biosynthesis